MLHEANRFLSSNFVYCLFYSIRSFFSTYEVVVVFNTMILLLKLKVGYLTLIMRTNNIEAYFLSFILTFSPEGADKVEGFTAMSL